MKELIEPQDLDHEHAARIRSLLDAFAAVGGERGGRGLFLHEPHIPHLAYVAASWARERGLKIDVRVYNSEYLYESWTITVECGDIHVYPEAMFMLGEPAQDVVEKINAIREAADERIRELTAVRSAS